MGRFAKNTRVRTGSYAIRMPIGTTAYEPADPNQVSPQYPESGQVKFNKNKNKLEVYYANSWNEISSSKNGRVEIVKDMFIGDGVTTSFAMSVQYEATGNSNMVLVFVGNLHQNPDVVYQVSGYMLTFGEAPPLNSNIIVMHNFNSTHTVN